MINRLLRAEEGGRSRVVIGQAWSEISASRCDQMIGCIFWFSDPLRFDWFWRANEASFPMLGTLPDISNSSPRFSLLSYKAAAPRPSDTYTLEPSRISHLSHIHQNDAQTISRYPRAPHPPRRSVLNPDSHPYHRRQRTCIPRTTERTAWTYPCCKAAGRNNGPSS